MTPEANQTPNPLPPSRATCGTLRASASVRDRVHKIVCDVGSLSDVAKGLADILEDAADGGEGIPARALVRLARALQADAHAAHLALDHLWLDTSPIRRGKTAGAEARA